MARHGVPHIVVTAQGDATPIGILSTSTSLRQSADVEQLSLAATNPPRPLRTWSAARPDGSS